MAATGGVHGFVPALSSFVGRGGDVRRLDGLLGEHRLVTVTGPGGVGKTRLAGEVARQVAGRFADGVWLVELAAVQDAAQVPRAVAAALRVQQAPGELLLQSLAGALARQQLLLVLDNCEHVLTAVAELCAALLTAADDLTVMATSREPVGLAGEVRLRLRPLPLPDPGIPPGMGVPAVALFVDRARQADPEFALDGETGPMVAELVARMDGMPLAIELAAARVEALGLAQMLDRMQDTIRLLTGGDRAAPRRHQSLAATVEWSYHLLGEPEQQVFRKLAVFPGAFTLDDATAVAGAAAEQAVLHLVDCSLVTPPRAGLDGRTRYVMLETIRAFARDRLADEGELAETSSALTRYALQVAEQTAILFATSSGELAAARRLDAEDAVMQQSLVWAMEHDPPTALRIAVALTQWRYMRGRAEEAYAQLSAAILYAEPGSGMWGRAQYWLGQAAIAAGDVSSALSHSTAARDVLAAGGPSRALASALTACANALTYSDRIAEGAAEARRALEMARAIGHPEVEVDSMLDMSSLARYDGDFAAALDWARRACRIHPASIPGDLVRARSLLLMVALIDAGEVTAARETSTATLALARDAGDARVEAFCLHTLAELDVKSGQLDQARIRLNEALRLTLRIRDRLRLRSCRTVGVDLCAAIGHWAEVVTLIASANTDRQDAGYPLHPQQIRREEELLRDAAQKLNPDLIHAAEERGSAMSLDTAAAFILALPETELQVPAAKRHSAPTAELSSRERELVTLVAQGQTDAQIAEKLFISISTVRSHLDRIRDKTGSRRRADLTRLALQAGLI
jgi:predicted ATPase/DNA-binding CsgD family transcriptional regulator